MTYETSIKKGRDGFRAESLIDLPGIRSKTADPGKAGAVKLSITTSKGSRGLRSYCTVGFYSAPLPGSIFSSFSFAMFGDFSKTVASAEGVRCTEKSVRALHELALAKVPELLPEITAFYAPKEVAA